MICIPYAFPSSSDPDPEFVPTDLDPLDDDPDDDPEPESEPEPEFEPELELQLPLLDREGRETEAETEPDVTVDALALLGDRGDNLPAADAVVAFSDSFTATGDGAGTGRDSKEVTEPADAATAPVAARFEGLLAVSLVG